MKNLQSTGTKCARLLPRPRTPNVMPDVSAFISRWDDPHAARQPARVATSAYGNINTLGAPGVHPADDVDPHHPQWYEALEPGVRPLVVAITATHRFVTYDSCEGHDYEVLDLPADHLRVGVLPRDNREFHAITAVLCKAAARAERNLPDSCRVTLGLSSLTCARTARERPVIDLVVEPVDFDSAAYFRDRFAAGQILTAELEAVSASDTCVCSSQSFFW